MDQGQIVTAAASAFSPRKRVGYLSDDSDSPGPPTTGRSPRKQPRQQSPATIPRFPSHQQLLPTPPPSSPAPQSRQRAEMTTIFGYAFREDLASSSEPRPLGTFAIEAAHPLVPLWPPIRDRILAELDRLAVRWSALEVFRRRNTMEREEGKDDTTVLLTGLWQDTNEELMVEQAVRDICRVHDQGGLRVELLHGEVGYFVAGQTASSPAPPQPTSQASSSPARSVRAAPLMGSSMSVRGLAWSSGTLGGYVTLSRGEEEEPIVCALTCHHVLRPTRPPGLRDETTVCYDSSLDLEDQLHPAVEVADVGLCVQAPSAAEHAVGQHIWRSSLADAEARITDLEAKIEMGMGNPARLRNLERARQDRAKFEAHLSPNPKLGHVWATSGYRTSEAGRALDWGLVRVGPDWQAENGTFHYPGLAHKKIEVVRTTTLPPLPKDGPDRSHFVVLLGAQSKVSMGFYSHIKSDCQLPGQGGPTREHAFVGEHPLTTFAAGGDSGGLVLSKDLKVVGMLIGGNPPSGHGYVTAIADIAADVKARTGHSLKLLGDVDDDD